MVNRPKFIEPIFNEASSGWKWAAGLKHDVRKTFTNTGVSSIDEDNLVPFVGLLGRVGMEMTFDRIGVFLEGTRNYNLYVPIAGGSHNTIGLGITYLID